MRELLKYAGYLPPFAPVAIARDRARDALVEALLDRNSDLVAKTRAALRTDSGSQTTDSLASIHRTARELLAALRATERDDLAGKLVGFIDDLVRSERRELMDLDVVPAWMHALEMQKLDEFNTLLGQYDQWARQIAIVLAGHKNARLCDLAAGSGGFFRNLAAHGIGEIELELVSSDVSDQYVSLGRNAAARGGLDVQFEVIDAVHLEKQAGRFDLFVCTQATHHLPPGLVVRMLASALRAAPLGILMIDVMRGAGFMLGAALGSSVVAPYFPVMVFDAVQSVRRGYTPAELRLLARLAGAANVSTKYLRPAHGVLHAVGVAGE